jgi:hypothetical protein
MYSKTVIPQARLTVESSLPSYEAGQSDFLGLQMNIGSALESEEQYHEELLNFHLAMIRLEEMTGMDLVPVSPTERNPR